VFLRGVAWVLSSCEECLKRLMTPCGARIWALFVVENFFQCPQSEEVNAHD
jgi:hypothetical protein